MIRILIPAGAPPGRIRLDDDEAHHLRVRRVEGPAEVSYTDGAGLRGRGHVIRAGNGFELDPAERESVPRPAARILAVGAGDRDRFTWLAEKATELGATQIIPLDTELTRSVATRLRRGGEERVARRAREALKQCGGAWAPEIHAPIPVAEFLAQHRGFRGARWLGDADGAAPAPVPGQAPAVAVVGPEGGLTGQERREFVEAGFAPVRFGPHILRFETAAIAALVLLQAHAGEP